MTTFAVTGSVVHRHRAERGVVHLSLVAEGTDREAVAAETEALHAQVAEQATGHRRQGAATWWSAQDVTVGPVAEPVRWDADGASSALGPDRPTRWRARSAVLVRFSDFGALATWVSELARVEGVSIDALEWSLGHDSRLEAERAARLAAVADAVTRADDYAEALGLSRPVLVALFEPGLRPGSSGGAATFGLARVASATSPAGGADGFDLAPADIEVHAEISADFTA
jgi:predicted secreted protein